MKKKSLVMMLVSLGLVGTIMVGATLAFFTDQTDAVTNTFSVGANVDIELYEDVTQTPSGNQVYVETTATDLTHVPTNNGAAFEDMYPGLELDKAPFVELAAGSSDCFVRVIVTGVDELVADHFTVAFNTGTAADEWTKVDGLTTLNGIYQYNSKVEGSTVAVKTEPVFKTITYDASNVELPTTTLENVVINAYAVQADGFEDADEAFTAEKDGTTTSEIDAVLMRPVVPQP